MSDTITKIASEYDMLSIMQNIGENYFGSNLSKQRVGMFGYLSESMAHMFGASVLDASIRSKEYNTATAQRLETLLYEAAMYNIDVNNAVPETMTVYMGIQTADIITPPYQGGFAKEEINVADTAHPSYTLVLEKDAVINIANYDFMFEYDIQIKATWSTAANKYVYAVKYLTEGDVDNTSTSTYNYPKADTLTELNSDYIQSYVTTKNNKSILIFKIYLKQMTKYTDYYSVVKNDMISLTGIDFLYDNMLSHFNIYYKENNKANWEYVKAVSIYDNKTYTADKIVHYEVIHDESKIRINFDGFTPAFNSEFRIDMYGTLGESINNLDYTGDGSDIFVNLNTLDERHSYTGLYLSCIPIVSYKTGQDVPDIETIRDLVIRAKSSLNSLDVENDLYNYIKGKDSLNDYVFIKKRLDAKERRYSAFTIPRTESSDIIPSSTLNMIIPLDKLYVDKYSGIEYPSEKSSDGAVYNKMMVLKAGTPLILNSNREGSEAAQSYRLCKEAIDRYYYGDDTHSATYEGSTEGREFNHKTTLMILDRSEQIVDVNGDYQAKYPDSRTIASYESEEKIFSNPYLIQYDKDNQIASYYLNSISEDVDTTMVEDYNDSDVHFVIDHINIYRNSLMGDTSYKVTVSVMPNGDFTKALSDSYANAGNVSNVVMLKGFLYKTSNDQMIDGYFDFEFEGYVDDVFKFSANIEVDDSIDDESSCTIMGNLHMIEDLQIYDDSIGEYSEIDDKGITVTTKYAKSYCNSGYLNMNIFDLKIGIGVYFLDYDTSKDGAAFVSTICDEDAGDRVMIETDTIAATNVTASTHSIDSGVQYPDFIMNCKYKYESDEYIFPVKYILTNVYTNENNLVDIYTDMTDFVKSNSTIMTIQTQFYKVDRDGNYYWSKKNNEFRYIYEDHSADYSNIYNYDHLTEEEATKLEDSDNPRVDVSCDDSSTENDVLLTGDAGGIEQIEADARDEYDPDTTTRYSYDGSTTTDFILLTDVPVVQFSKVIDEDTSDMLISTINNTHTYLKEMNERLTNNFSLDYKFFRTYGPCRYFTLSTVDGNDKLVINQGCCTDDNCNCDNNETSTIAYPGTTELGNLDITLEFTVLIRNGLSISDAEVISKLKNHIKSYIEDINEDDTDYTIYMSNIITELESTYIDLVKSVELVSTNGKPDVYRILQYSLPEELMDTYISSTSDDIREYVPEYINVPLDNITINITRTKY